MSYIIREQFYSKDLICKALNPYWKRVSIVFSDFKKEKKK